MNINSTINGSELTVAVDGRLDISTAADFDKALKANLDGVTTLIIDMKDLEYVSSAGLRVLLATQKAMDEKGGSMKIRNVNETISEVFIVTGFADILTVE